MTANVKHHAEERLIGLLLRCPERMDDVKSQGVTARDFDVPTLQNIFQIASDQWTASNHFGVYSIASSAPELMPTLLRLEQDSDMGDVVTYATAIKRHRWVDETIMALNELQGQMMRCDRNADVEIFQAKLAALAGTAAGDAIGKSASIPIATLAERFLANYESRSVKNYAVIPCGVNAISNLIGGWGRGQMIVIAARPGMGKTTLATQAALYTALTHRVGFCTIEMTADDLFDSFVAHVGAVNSRKVRKGDLDIVDQIFDAADDLAKRNLSVYESNGNMSAISTEIRKLHRNGCQLIVVDYIQIMHDREQRHASRVAELSYISTELKRLALTLNVPVIVTAQVNREFEKRTKHSAIGDITMPGLADIKDCGSIEQDADVVIFLNRREDEKDKEKGRVGVRVAKNRRGPSGSLMLNGDFTIGLIQ